MAPQQLENTASKYASEAIKCDSQGARGMAIANYQKAASARTTQNQDHLQAPEKDARHIAGRTEVLYELQRRPELVS